MPSPLKIGSLNLDWESSNDDSGRLGSAAVHGICMTMSCHWAKATVKNGKKLTAQLNTNRLAMGAMHVVRTKEQNLVDAGGGDFDERVDAWHKGFFTRLNVLGTKVGSGSHVPDLTSKEGVYVLTIYGAGGHTMAFARFKDFSVFFDPNAGQYSCAASVLSSIKKDVGKHIKDEYSALLKSWFVYKIAR
jgi:hypothetical protein